MSIVFMKQLVSCKAVGVQICLQGAGIWLRGSDPRPACWIHGWVQGSVQGSDPRGYTRSYLISPL